MHLADLETNNFSSLRSIHLHRTQGCTQRSRERRSSQGHLAHSFVRPSASVPSRNPTLLARIFLASYRPRPVFSDLYQVLAQLPFLQPKFPSPVSAKLQMKNGGCIAMRISSLGRARRGVQRTFSPVPELPALMHPPCISA